MNKLSIGFHIHTNYSYDGYNSFEQIYNQAIKNKVEVLCITDHDTVEGAIKFKEWLVKKKHLDIEVVICEEITCDDGTHIIGLFLEKEIASANPLEVIDEIKKQNGLVYLPHPARKDGALNSIYSNELLQNCDVYEIFNAKINDKYNKEAMKQMPENVAIAGGADAHYNSDIGKCICYIKKETSTKESIFNFVATKSIEIYGKRKLDSSNNYFSFYYRYKQKLNLPQFIRDLAKNILPHIKNFKEKNKKYVLELIYSNRGVK